jgi:nicotinamide-nucleotide amidase
MKAAFLAVGSELLGADRVETNSLRVSERLRRHGVALGRKVVVGDDEDEIAREVRDIVGRFDLLVISGGLGPTADDLTREGVARATGRSLARAENVVDEIRARFASFGRTMPEVNRRQADVIEGATVISNPRGSAPGQMLTVDQTTLVLVPGVPRELEGMLDDVLEPWLAERTGADVLETRVLKVACLAESDVEERIAPAWAELGRENLTILAKPGEITLQYHVRGADAEARDRRLAAGLARLRELIGPATFGEGEATLESVVGELLLARGQTIGTAESCTGGLVATRLTGVAGSSAWYMGSIVAYDYGLKVGGLGVEWATIERVGAVSEEVAREMAEGGRSRLGVDWCVGITGIAGPGGATPEKPVGLVHFAIAGPNGTSHRRAQFPGDRVRVRQQASQLALELVRRRLLRVGEAGT